MLQYKQTSLASTLRGELHSREVMWCVINLIKILCCEFQVGNRRCTWLGADWIKECMFGNRVGNDMDQITRITLRSKKSSSLSEKIWDWMTDRRSDMNRSWSNARCINVQLDYKDLNTVHSQEGVSSLILNIRIQKYFISHFDIRHTFFSHAITSIHKNSLTVGIFYCECTCQVNYGIVEDCEVQCDCLTTFCILGYTKTWTFMRLVTDTVVDLWFGYSVNNNIGEHYKEKTLFKEVRECFCNPPHKLKKVFCFNCFLKFNICSCVDMKRFTVNYLHTAYIGVKCCMV